MSEDEKKRTLTWLEKLKQTALQQKHYGGEVKKEDASLDVRDCPNCGAGRAFRHGLTSCAYCGFVFMEVKLTDGIHIKKENNS